MASSSNPKKQKGPVVEEVVLHDWRRTEGALNPVRNQELTESCWAFAITAGMESSYHIINNFQCQITLSPQDLLDNYEGEDDVKEPGAQPFRVFNWIFYNGCVSDEVCPFRNNVDKISNPNRKPQYRIDTFKMVPYKDLEKEVAERPIVAQLNYTDEFWELKKDEIYCGPKGSYCPSKLIGHSVLIVGFGKIKEKGREKKYCIVRNSWGKEWCDNGYGKVSLELVFDSERKEHVPLLDSMLSPVSVIKM